jgi:hypothetical protein
MAGLKGSVAFEDALGIASFMVTMERVPHPSLWVDELIAKGVSAFNEGWSENFF